MLSCSPADGRRINCIVAHSTGFVCSSMEGRDAFDKIDSEGTQFALMKTLSVLGGKAWWNSRCWGGSSNQSARRG